VKNAPDIREDIVAPLKQQVQNGTYDVSADDFADKMLAEFA
jgi:negative regulator of flagellin synthesis FlgM